MNIIYKCSKNELKELELNLFSMEFNNRPIFNDVIIKVENKFIRYPIVEAFNHWYIVT